VVKYRTVSSHDTALYSINCADVESFFYCLLIIWFHKCCWFSLCWTSLCVISAWKFLVHAVKNIPNEDNQCSSGLSPAVVGSANGSVQHLYQW